MMDCASRNLEAFSGVAPIFPLPNVVLFPGGLLPLHIFEQRYRKMLEDALAAERLMAMSLTRPGWETDNSGRPPVHKMVCLGRVVSHQRLPSGKYNVVLQGLQRAGIVEELPSALPYRKCRLELQADFVSKSPVIDRRHRREELLAIFRSLFPILPGDHLANVALDAEVPLGSLCDALAHALPVHAQRKQLLLHERNVDLRSDQLLDELRQLIRSRRVIPDASRAIPEFSVN